MYYKKYLSVFLLFVFSWLLLPPVLLHRIFANHHDTVCDLKHRHSVTTVEALHIHCDIFTTNTPVYDAPELAALAKPIRVLIAELACKIHFLYLQATLNLLPARAPPLC
jgi:hypothetical protein